MTTSYFTFGCGHVHRVGGFTYDVDVLVKITADDPRQVMFDTFGKQWCMEYSEEQLPKILPYCPRGIKIL